MPYSQRRSDRFSFAYEEVRLWRMNQVATTSGPAR
jgi:hypothetical protein